MVSHKVAPLVACVVHDEGDFGVGMFLAYLFQECDDAQRVDVVRCPDADEFPFLAPS